MTVREKQPRRAARGQHVPFSGLVQAHTPGKSRVFAAVGMEGTGETDWPAERTGFELAVPLRWTALRSEVVEEAFGSARYDERGRPQRPAVSACAIP